LKNFFFDLDGTITENGGYGVSEINIPWIILWILLSFYKPKINQKVIQIINNTKKENKKVIIITARPEKLKRITEKYLFKNNVYFDEIFFVGTGKDSFSKKIEIISKKDSSLFFENNEKNIEKAKKRKINCVLIKKTG
jgi:uncharacterized HAD superfamily protein